MTLKTIILENVNVDYLEEQRIILGDVCSGGEMTAEAMMALEGIVNMLDVWSDSEREAVWNVRNVAAIRLR